MDNKKNTRETIHATVYWRYPQNAGRSFPWTIAFIAFQFFTMAFLAPAPLRAAYTIHQGSDVEIQGDYAYVAVTGTSNSSVTYMTSPPPELPSGLRVIDISDPSSPEIVGGLDYSNSGILCLTVEDNLAYLAYSGSEGVKIIDISNPEDPEIVGTIKNVYAREIVIRDGYAYIADPELGLVIVDVSVPASPVRAARLNLNSEVVDISVQGIFAYLTFDGFPTDCGLYVCDISNPKSPFLVDRFVAATAATSDISPGPMKIWLKGNYAYLARGASNIIVDVSNPANPSQKGMVWILPGLPPYAHVPSVNDLAGSGEYMYMIASGQEGQEKLFVVDIADPLDPDPLGDVSTYKAKGVAVQGDYACIIGNDGFQIIDISDPDLPSVAGRIKSTQPSGTTGTGISVYGYGYGFPYLPGYGRFGYGYGYGYPLSGYGTYGGYGYGYPLSGFGASGGYRYGYPLSGYGTSGGYRYGSSSGFGSLGGYGYGYPFSGFGASGGYRYGYPISGYGTSGGYRYGSSSGFGSLGGYGYGYPFSGFGASGGYRYGYPISGYGTSGGYGYPPGWRPFL